MPGPPFHAVFIRAPWVERIGPQVEILATSQPQVRSSPSVRVGHSPRVSTRAHQDNRVHKIFIDM